MQHARRAWQQRILVITDANLVRKLFGDWSCVLADECTLGEDDERERLVSLLGALSNAREFLRERSLVARPGAFQKDEAEELHAL